MITTTPDSPERLNTMMDFDHVIRVHPDGSVSDAEPSAPWAPTLYDHETDNFAELHSGAGWRLMSGYTGQCGYRGPIMHPSEYIGGRLARDILDAPGLYVALVAEVLDCDECTDSDTGEEIADPECCGEHEPAGWAIAYIAD